MEDVPDNLTIKKVLGNNKWSSLTQKLSQDKATREGWIMDGTKCDPKELVPTELWDYLDIFDEDAAKRLLQHSNWDLEINFEEGVQLPTL